MFFCYFKNVIYFIGFLVLFINDLFDGCLLCFIGLIFFMLVFGVGIYLFFNYSIIL